MSYSQEIYDAVRSRIYNGDIGAVVRDVAADCFDLGNLKYMLQAEAGVVTGEMTRPSVLYRPEIMADGDKWCALLGDNLQIGVSGFGDTPAAAMAAFDEAFWNGLTPTAVRMNRDRDGSGEAGQTAKQAGPVGQQPGPSEETASPNLPDLSNSHD